MQEIGSIYVGDGPKLMAEGRALGSTTGGT